MESYKTIERLNESYNSRGYNSHSDIDRLNAGGEIKSDFERLLIPDLLRTDIRDFTDKLLNVNPHIIRQKLLLERAYGKDLSYNGDYMLSHYLDDKFAYRNIPQKIYDIIHKIGIEEFKYVDISDIKNKFYRYLDVKEGIDTGRGISICELEYNGSPRTELYDKCDKLFDPKNVYVGDKDLFFTWAEHTAYNYELELTKGSSLEDRVIWVSRYYGDYYGFDILSIDINTNREKLIEVKSGKGKYCTISINESNVMRNSQYKNCDYYVYRSYLDNDNIVKTDRYKYIPELDLMIDEELNLYSIDKYNTVNGNDAYGFNSIDKKYNNDGKSLLLKN